MEDPQISSMRAQKWKRSSQMRLMEALWHVCLTIPKSSTPSAPNAFNKVWLPKAPPFGLYLLQTRYVHYGTKFVVDDRKSFLRTSKSGSISYLSIDENSSFVRQVVGLVLQFFYISHIDLAVGYSQMSSTRSAFAYFVSCSKSRTFQQRRKACFS